MRPFRRAAMELVAEFEKRATRNVRIGEIICVLTVQE